MSGFLTVLLSLVFCSLVFGSTAQLAWKEKELSFNSEDDEFHLRSLSLNTNWHGVWYHSLQTDIDTKQPKVDGDFIWGSIYIGRKDFPVNWQGYWAATVTANRTVDPTKANWESFDVSFTSSFVAAAYLKLFEKNATGFQVAEEPLNTLWYYDAATSQTLTNKTAGLYANVFTTTLSNGATMEIQYILTQQSGVLDVLDGVEVVPKAVETIVVINNWPYASLDNTLSLVMAAGSADISLSASGHASSGTGDDAVFFRVAGTAQIDGKMEDTKVTVEKSSDITASFGASGVTVQLSQKYGKSATCGIFTVEFPAGAKEIVYDPTMGSGEDPFDDNSKTGMIIGIVLGVVVLVVLVVVGVHVYRKRAAYQSI